MFERPGRFVVLFGGLMIVGIVSLGGCYSYGYPDDRRVLGPVVVAQPPAPLVEEAPPEPFSDALWIDGYWRWVGTRYVWVHGYYVRPRPGLYWYPGGWMARGEGFVWVGGRWAPRSYMGTYQRRYHRRFIYRGHPAYRHYRRHPTRWGYWIGHRHARGSRGVRRARRGRGVPQGGRRVRSRRSRRRAVPHVTRAHPRSSRVRAARPQHPRKGP